ncbi:hypothetical protein GUJ93_ZPchr0009g793 [Zizania palustris]|uniref:Uncharacterized protein n=1 Tax=Zizania palustris TaxID=103762 RepID=A0A8J5RQ24_ZIZPA|nr:hypothetical protein GUJ93_ZPchr0009g793 [Zizania palustris]
MPNVTGDLSVAVAAGLAIVVFALLVSSTDGSPDDMTFQTAGATNLFADSKPVKAYAVADRRLTPEQVALVVNLYRVAMACVEEASMARPTMREVVHMLSDSNPSNGDLVVTV